MIKIVQAVYQAVYQAGVEIKLHFSDGSFGVMDFSEVLSHKTSLTRALDDAAFFQRFFIELGGCPRIVCPTAVAANWSKKSEIFSK